MDSSSSNLLNKVFTFLNDEYYKNDGVQFLNKNIDIDQISTVLYTYDDGLGVSKEGKQIIFKKDQDLLLTKLPIIINELNNFVFRQVKFSLQFKELKIETKEIKIDDGDYYIIMISSGD